MSKGDYVYSSLAEDIYKDFAPLSMIHEFRYGIFNPTENDEFTVDGDEYVNSFRFCQRYLLPIKYLHDFNLIFTKFTRQIDILNDENLLHKKWKILKKPVRHLWFTFAQGLRCLEHDSYYDDKFGMWEIIFKNSISDLDFEINEIINESDEWVDFSKFNGLSDKERDFLSPLINIYLEDD